MEGWMLLWKTVFIVTLLGFGAMSVWVIYGGYHDIKKLMKALKEDDGGEDS